ncbi:MAG: HAMP domain-containing histidine kinase [Hyphomicrobiales bacterium]|nr:HAMP domain-containing histidine kinase [Hyphomicrobiales bacterium]
MLSIFLIIITLALVISFAVLTNIFDRSIENVIKIELDSKIIEIIRLFRIDRDSQPVLTQNPSDPRYEIAFSGAYWLVFENNKSILRSRSLWDQDINIPDKAGIEDDSKLYLTGGPNKSKVYLLERDISLGGPQSSDHGKMRKFEIAVALDAGEVAHLRQAFQKDTAIALALIAVALLLGAVAQAGIGLQPLTELRHQLARIHNRAATRLNGSYPAEVAPLVEVVNQLLVRQDDLVSRARRRAGDLAHGLKTPLTILALEANALEKKGDFEAASALREQIGLMRNHIDRELARARTHGLAAAGGLATDAHRSISRLIGLFDRMPDADRLTWRNLVPETLRLNMDPDDFGEVMGNLLDNARKFAQSEIRIEAKRVQFRWKITVIDDGPGMPAASIHRWLERGQTTAAAGEGTGLGLAIVQDILEQYQTGIEVDPDTSAGNRISFSI